MPHWSQKRPVVSPQRNVLELLSWHHKEQNSVKANGCIGPAQGLVVLEIPKTAQHRACHTTRSHGWLYCSHCSISEAEMRTFQQKASNSASGLSGTAALAFQVCPRLGRSSTLGHIQVRTGGWTVASSWQLMNLYWILQNVLKMFPPIKHSSFYCHLHRWL